MLFNSSHYFQKTLFTLILTLLCFTASMAADKTPEFITFTLENDFFVGHDDGYTSGMGITFGKGPFNKFGTDNLPGWLYWLTKDLYVSTMQNKRRGIAHMFFQRMQTPADLTQTDLIIDDVPYVGLLAWQGTLYAWDDNLTEQLSIYLGAVGPITFAEQTQIEMHGLMGANKPEGWNNQIENEIIFKIEAQRVWNLYRSTAKDRQFDILGLWNAGIGTLESATKAGLAIRWGTNLQHSFPTFSLQADRQINPLSLSPNNDFYLFLGAGAGVVFNNILIDGNTFSESYSVPLEHYQNQLSSGAVWNIGRNAFVFQISSISSPTTITNKREDFGALSFTYSF